jgi:hypothetical protein
MNIQHINIKFFIEKPDEVKLEEYAGIFNNWIQRHILPELLIDVADYIHVYNGPGVILIGHEADYSLDNRLGRLGLLYNRKAALDGSVQEKLAQATRAALTAARLLEKENGVKFSGQEAQVTINDRLLVPNTLETFAALETDLRVFFETLYGGAEYTLAYQSADPRERFTVSVKTDARFEVETLLKNLATETVHA